MARKRNGLIVSDHAVVRYLERVNGIDIEAVRETIRADVWKARAIGLTHFETDDGLIYSMRLNEVKTVQVRPPVDIGK